MKNYFWKNTSGGMAINFAIASTALFIAIGAATDLSLLTSEKSKLQDWADSTALAAAVSGETESSEFQSFAETFMDSSPFPCLLYTSPSPRDGLLSRMPSSA